VWKRAPKTFFSTFRALLQQSFPHPKHFFHFWALLQHLRMRKSGSELAPNHEIWSQKSELRRKRRNVRVTQISCLTCRNSGLRNCTRT
jgi:hypothetical protein